MRYELFHDVLAEPVLDWRRRHEQERARRAAYRRFARVGGVLLSLVAVFAALGIWALLQRSQASTARDRAASLALASVAKAQLPARPDVALLLGLEANRVGSTPQATSVMMAALEEARTPGVRAILHTGTDSSIAISPDGRTLAVSYGGKTALWDMATRRQIGPPLRGASGEVVFSPDGRTLASAGSARTELWDPRTHRRLGRPLPLSGPIAFSPDGRLLAANDRRGGAVLWDVIRRRPRLRLHAGMASSFAFTPDGRTLAAGYPAAGVGGWQLWDVASGRALTGLLGQSLNAAGAILVSPDGHRIIVSKSVGSLEILDLPGRKLQTLRLPHRFLSSPALSNDGRILATGDQGHRGVVLFFDADTLARIGSLRVHTDGIDQLVFSPDGRTIVSSSSDGTVRFWERNAVPELPQVLRGHTGRVTSVAVSADGRTLATGGRDATVRLWDLQARAPSGRALDSPGGRVWSVAFSPDGRTVAAGAYKTVELWDVRTRRLIARLHGPTGQVAAVAFSPDGRLLASGGTDGTVRFWDPLTHEPAGPPLRLERTVRTIAFSPDGRRLATATWRGIRLWDARSGRPLGSLPLTGFPFGNGLAFSRDGRSLVSLTDNVVTFWDVNTLRRRGRPLKMGGQDDVVTAAALSPDGRVLAVSNGGSVSFWDIRTRTALADYIVGGSASALAFTPDGRTLAAVEDDSNDARLLRDVNWQTFDELRDQVCGLVFGNLTRSEWDELAPGVAYRTTCAG
jgi:WD40 repeat protein